jgi:transposase
MKKPRTKHSKEFKEQAVAMMKTRTHAEVARQLGINSSLLYKWRDQFDTHGEDAFPSHSIKAPLSELELFKADNEDSQREMKIYD